MYSPNFDDDWSKIDSENNDFCIIGDKNDYTRINELGNPAFYVYIPVARLYVSPS